MRRPLRTLGLPALLLLAAAPVAAQPWHYDFSNNAETPITTSSSSQTFLKNIPSGGGTGYVRVAASGTTLGSIALANPGDATLGAENELVVVAPSGASANKWSIFDHTAGTFQSVAMSLNITGTSGTTILVTGNGGAAPLNSFNAATGYTGAQTMGYLRFTLAAGVLTGATRTTSGTFTTFGGGVTLTAGTTFRVEIYANNSASSVSYSRAGVEQTLATRAYDVFVNGVRVADEILPPATGGTIFPVGTSLDSFFMETTQSASSNMTVHVDDLTYSNKAPTSTTGTTAGWRLLGVPTGLPTTGAASTSRIDSVLMRQHLVQGLSDEYTTGTPSGSSCCC